MNQNKNLVSHDCKFCGDVWGGGSGAKGLCNKHYKYYLQRNSVRSNALARLSNIVRLEDIVKNYENE